MPMGMVITFPGNYCVGQGNTINKSISISLYLLIILCNYSLELPGLDINVCPIPVKTDVGQVDLVSRTSEKMNVLPFEGYFL
jgi:hypothetical protein